MQVRDTYTFDSFIPGNNLFARNVLYKISENVDDSYFSPVCIYGDSGNGKTHLLQAVFNSIRENCPELKMAYISCEEFLNGFVDAIRGNGNTTPKQYKDQFRDLDCLILEDVQMLAGRKSTTQTLFQIYDALYLKGAKIIFSCNVLPAKLQDIEERYISRFAMALSVELKVPDYETRLQIIEAKSTGMNLILANDVQHFLAENITSSVRAIEGALTILSARHRNGGTPAYVQDVNVVREELSDIIRPKQYRISIEHIGTVVAQYYDISLSDITGRSRRVECTFARQVAMYLCTKLTDETLSVIGIYFGGRDHSTVSHSIEKIMRRLRESPGLNNILDHLSRQICLKAEK